MRQLGASGQGGVDTEKHSSPHRLPRLGREFVGRPPDPPALSESASLTQAYLFPELHVIATVNCSKNREHHSGYVSHPQEAQAENSGSPDLGGDS